MAQVDIRRGTSGVSLPAAVSNEIWSNVVEDSVVARVSRRIDLPGSGVTVPIISGEATAEWVAETEEKTVSRPTLSNKTITPYTLALIVPFSNQFRRDLGGLYNAMVQQLPKAIAKKFDQTVFGYYTAPGSNFDTLAAAPNVSINTAGTLYTNFLTALGSVGAAGGDISAWIMSLQGEIKMLGETDADDRPLFTTSPNTDGLRSIGQILGRPVVASRHVYGADDVVNAEESTPDTLVDAQTLGMAGDWQDGAVWGQVEAIDVSISDQATINDGGTLLHLWQRNMFGVRVECEMGFRVKDVNRFVRLTGADLGT